MIFQKIIITAKQLTQGGRWEKACEVLGLNVYALAEGMDPDTEFELTTNQLNAIGIWLVVIEV